MSPETMSESFQEYLEAILRLSHDKPGVLVANADIAGALGIKPPSVTEMLEKLERQGLITWEKRRGVELTATGHEAASKMLEIHRLLEEFFTAVLELDDPELKHRVACSLEHHVVHESRLVDALHRAIHKARNE